VPEQGPGDPSQRTKFIAQCRSVAGSAFAMAQALLCNDPKYPSGMSLVCGTGLRPFLLGRLICLLGRAYPSIPHRFQGRPSCGGGTYLPWAKARDLAIPALSDREPAASDPLTLEPTNQGRGMRWQSGVSFCPSRGRGQSQPRISSGDLQAAPSDPRDIMLTRSRWLFHGSHVRATVSRAERSALDKWASTVWQDNGHAAITAVKPPGARRRLLLGDLNM
jgi:hypothetical protein